MRMRRKAWTEPVIAGCPFYVEQPSARRGHWRELFPREQPVWLEIGCGKGVSTARMAHENPGVNVIAVDEVRHVRPCPSATPAPNTATTPWTACAFRPWTPCSIHDTFSRGDGIERIYIHFCNPWDEKAKHHKRRLTHTRQLAQYRDFLAPGGRIFFKTDNDALFAATQRYLRESRFESKP